MLNEAAADVALLTHSAQGLQEESPVSGHDLISRSALQKIERASASWSAEHGSHSSRRAFLGTACTAVAACCLPNAAEAGPVALRSGLAWASGCRWNPDGLASFRGRRIDAITTYLGRRDWNEIASAGGISGSISRPETIVVSYPLFPDNYNPKRQGYDLWRRAASGEFDKYHLASASVMGRSGRKFIFRIGWEWNNDTFNWACHDVKYASSYISYFRRVVNLLRSKNGSSLIDWSCDKEGRTNADVRKWYPGNAYVDLIGCNKYDFWPALKAESVWESDLNRLRYGGPVGLNAWLNFAKSNGKLLTVGEWGLTTGSPHGGGDNPFFIEKMLRFFNANARYIGYESIFNRNTDSFRHDLASNPKAGAMYRKLMQPGAL